jgi:uncharacterized protein YcbX
MKDEANPVTVVAMHVEALFRYPVKSMGGERLDAAQVGWHGFDGDRRHALRRVEDRSGFPWLTGSKLPELVTFRPALPSIRTHDGTELTVDDIARRYGQPLELMKLDAGIFDEGTVSVITAATIGAIAPDVRRFRPNIFLRTDGAAFEEDAWVGRTLAFGDDGPVLHVTQRDERCVMINFDPDTAESDPQILKTVVRLNDNKAGIYATVIRTGRITVGQRVTVA